MKETSSSSLRLPVGLAFFGFVLSGMNDGINGVLLPSLSAFYSVGDAVIGLLFFVSSFGYFLSALSSGFLTQRFGLRWILLFGTTTFLPGPSVATGLASRLGVFCSRIWPSVLELARNG